MNYSDVRNFHHYQTREEECEWGIDPCTKSAVFVGREACFIIDSRRLHNFGKYFGWFYIYNGLIFCFAG